mgnify:FL=1
MKQPFELTIAEASLLIRDRELSPAELMESCLRRSELLDSKLRIWANIDPEAALEDASKKSSVVPNPVSSCLNGIPVGVKDIFNVAGVPNTAGSELYSDFVPEYDSAPVEFLKQAGAIIMGKTITTEFAMGDPPITKNPWNFFHTPGGSSSGSAVGVASKVFPAALGSQTAGSVIRPASFNGIVGFKPSFGLISRFGVLPVSSSLDTVGYFTRCVEDIGIVSNALAGYDHRDPSSEKVSKEDYLAQLKPTKIPPMIGLVNWFFLESCDSQAKNATLKAAGILEDHGASVEEIQIDFDSQTLLAAHQTIMSVEAAVVHKQDFKKHANLYSPFIKDVIERGLLTPSIAYIQAQRIRRIFRQKLADATSKYDILLTTATDAGAPKDLETTGNPSYQVPWTMAGLPVISLPCGLDQNGLPLGIQIVGHLYSEATLLSYAKWCESILDTQLPEADMEI